MKILMGFSLMLVLSFPAYAYELATKTVMQNDTVSLTTVGYSKVLLIKEAVDKHGLIHASGSLTVKGSANIVLWVKVEGAYYFSKLPKLQKIQDKRDVEFLIPFNAGKKRATEVRLEVEMLEAGEVTLSGFRVSNGE